MRLGGWAETNKGPARGDGTGTDIQGVWLGMRKSMEGDRSGRDSGETFGKGGEWGREEGQERRPPADSCLEAGPC